MARERHPLEESNYLLYLPDSLETTPQEHVISFHQSIQKSEGRGSQKQVFLSSNTPLD
jgi:hypothetical protein